MEWLAFNSRLCNILLFTANLAFATVSCVHFITHSRLTVKGLESLLGTKDLKCFRLVKMSNRVLSTLGLVNIGSDV